MPRTRVKICGLTRADDVDAAVAAGADAIGLVFYPPSPRFVEPCVARELARRVPPLVTLVGLFVNAEPAWVEAVLAQVPLQLLQFHGNETDAECARYGRPFVKVARMRPGFDLLNYAASFPNAGALLLDTYVDGYGGGGKVFDWSLIPPALPLPLILSGGLDAANVGDAVARLRPYAVDVSSGVEQAKGLKDPAKIMAFMAGVQDADGR